MLDLGERGGRPSLESEVKFKESVIRIFTNIVDIMDAA